MTFSIVAADTEKNEVGFAIASCFWDAGQMGLAFAGKGAIVSQAQGNWEFIPIFFEKLDDGLPLKEILEIFRSSDENFENRQIGMVSFQGESLAFTGGSVFSAHQRIGKNYACQGNILTSPATVDRMAEVFEATEGTLTRKLYEALQAGDDAGGEMRGKMSARVYVVRVRDNPLPVNDYRIEDHQEPVREIGRLITLKNDIITAWELTEEASKIVGSDKQHAIRTLETFLIGKEDRAFLDFHETLASIYLSEGNKEKAIERYRIYAKISPNMVSTFDDDLKKEILAEQIT
ncbi:DUF1028 domain-containing protein [Candidatus Thorarchaeota archaeon]|nr:MAG: DUF1028 domain-containing protein [Candidatus Thorarchaeota archaeon]